MNREINEKLKNLNKQVFDINIEVLENKITSLELLEKKSTIDIMLMRAFSKGKISLMDSYNSMCLGIVQCNLKKLADLFSMKCNNLAVKFLQYDIQKDSLVMKEYQYEDLKKENKKIISEPVLTNGQMKDYEILHRAVDKIDYSPLLEEIVSQY